MATEGGKGRKGMRRASGLALADRVCRWIAGAAFVLLVLLLAAQLLLTNDGIRGFLSGTERLEGEPFPVVPFLHPSP